MSNRPYLARMAAQARRTGTVVTEQITPVDIVTCQFHEDWVSDQIEWRHNGVLIDENRAFELIGDGVSATMGFAT